MAKLQLSVHIDLREAAQPLVDALQNVANSVEGYKLGRSDKIDANYHAMLWGVAHLSSLISKERPSYEFGYSDDHDEELKTLFDGGPFPPDTPYE